MMSLGCNVGIFYILSLTSIFTKQLHMIYPGFSYDFQSCSDDSFINDLKTVERGCQLYY